MSMRPEQDNVQALRHLLALKKHEQPPPGYFNSFSSRVIARIEAGERAPDSLWDRLAELWAAFETKPLLAGAVGITFCGLITTGFLFSDHASGLQTAPVSMYAPGQAMLGTGGGAPAASVLFDRVPGLDGMRTGGVEVIQVEPSLFQHPNTPRTFQAKFILP